MTAGGHEPERRPPAEDAPIWLDFVLYLAAAGALLAVLVAFLVAGVPCDSGNGGGCSQPVGQLLLALLGFGMIIASWSRKRRGHIEQSVILLVLAVVVFAGWGFAFDSVFH